MMSGVRSNRGGLALFWITAIWLVGTLILARLTLAQLLSGSDWNDPPKNPTLALALVVATAAIAFGMPLIGFFVALATRKHIAAGLFAAVVVALMVAAARAGLLPIDQIFSSQTSNEPEVCTAPPTAMEGVPGC
ncbi:hypothetical protein JOL79_14585 [Microbispora sp. RL4-1S]|uniref:Uncharacterized protein n=1 Tax=Microbispora oryzae TaxID=2806554 RepID=A0A941AIC1_9ACTN|nr:hypothetical protein [Microbispora oryzae]MBP2705040.1 hypothetical protein [Microbispora oryzae]